MALKNENSKNIECLFTLFLPSLYLLKKWSTKKENPYFIAKFTDSVSFVVDSQSFSASLHFHDSQGLSSLIFLFLFRFGSNRKVSFHLEEHLLAAQAWHCHFKTLKLRGSSMNWGKRQRIPRFLHPLAQVPDSVQKPFHFTNRLTLYS